MDFSHGGVIRRRRSRAAQVDLPDGLLVAEAWGGGQLNSGKAYFTNTGQFILLDFMKKKTRRVS